MEERYQKLKNPLDADEFEVKPSKPTEAGLSNIVRRGFALLFGWNRGKMRRVRVDNNGGLMVSVEELTQGKNKLYLDGSGRMITAPADSYDSPRDHFIGTIAAPGAGAAHTFAASQKCCRITTMGTFTGYVTMSGGVGSGRFYCDSNTGEFLVYGKFTQAIFTVVGGAVSYSLTSYEPQAP